MDSNGCRSVKRSFQSSSVDLPATGILPASGWEWVVRNIRDEFGAKGPCRFDTPVTGRIVTLTSDALNGEVASGVSKVAIDRLTCAAAIEIAPREITANAVNPGPNDTGHDAPDHALGDR